MLVLCTRTGVQICAFQPYLSELGDGIGLAETSRAEMICAIGVLFLFSFFFCGILSSFFFLFVNILFYYWRGELERGLDFMDTTQGFFRPFLLYQDVCILDSVWLKAVSTQDCQPFTLLENSGLFANSGGPFYL